MYIYTFIYRPVTLYYNKNYQCKFIRDIPLKTNKTPIYIYIRNNQ